MYAIYAYIDPSNHPNVGIYGIHGVSGIGVELETMDISSCSQQCYSTCNTKAFPLAKQVLELLQVKGMFHFILPSGSG